MGNQQLLLITLGVIIVAIAVVVGINMFSNSFAEQVKDMAILKVNDIGMRANIYRKKSVELGGGDGSYEGFNEQFGSLFKEDEIIKKTKFVENVKNIKMTLILRVKGENGKKFKVWAKYKPNGLRKLRVYEPDSDTWVWLYNP